jgi:hypothetical protein
MLPRREAELPLSEIAKFWQREIVPQVTSDEALDALVKAFWRGLFDTPGDNRVTRLAVLRELYGHAETNDTLRLVGAGARASQETTLPDGSVEVDLRPIIPLPAGPPETWTDATCADAYAALAKTSIDDLPRDIAKAVGAKPVRFEQFCAFVKAKYPEHFPLAFWKPSGKQTSGAEQEEVASEPSGGIQSKHYAPPKVEEWYRRWIKQHKNADRIPTRNDDWAAARKEFPGIRREQVRDLRRDLAPAEWHKKGRPASANR